MATATSIVNMLSGGTLLALALGLALVTRERSGRLLALYASLTGFHFFGLGLARVVVDPASGAALVRLAHVTIYFAFVPLVLLASELTGAHRSLWRKPWTIALMLLLPLGLLALELARPSPIVVFRAGEPSMFEDDSIVQGRFFGWWMVDLMALTAAFVYITIGLARSLARENDPSAIAGRALLLSAFAVPAARSLREALSSEFRWIFLRPLGASGPPPLLPHDLPTQLVAAAVLTLLPGFFLLRASSTRAKEAGWAALILAAIVSIMITLSAAAQPPVGNLRWLFFALLVTYAAIRHGLFRAERLALAIFERPLAAAAFGALGMLCVTSIDVVATDEVAIPAGIGLAAVATALVLAVSGPPKRHATGARYSVERELGRGAQGRVLLALDNMLHRSVVLKRVSGGDDALREARAAARVNHPSLVSVYDVSQEPDGPVLVMEYVPGGTLEDRLRGGPLGRAEARRLATELLDGLAALHQARLVHGDIKAGNVFFREDGRAALGDFGSAHVLSAEQTLASLGRAPASASLAGVAPEVLSGEHADPRADIYAMGALLYRALTGESYVRFPPTFEDAKHAVLTAAPLLPHARVPAGWEKVILRALAKRPEDRYQSAKEMRAAVALAEG